MIACYVLGSLAHGGFSRYASDVDFAIILKDPFQPTNFNQTINKINKQILSSQLPLAEKISIYFATPETLCSSSNEIRFPAYDRLDLILNGKILYGEDIRSHILRPEEKEIAIEGMKAYFQHFNKDELIFQIIHLDELIMQGGAHKAGKLILLPVSFKDILPRKLGDRYPNLE